MAGTLGTSPRAGSPAMTPLGDAVSGFGATNAGRADLTERPVLTRINPVFRITLRLGWRDSA
jgi:hypothetical protein